MPKARKSRVKLDRRLKSFENVISRMQGPKETDKMKQRHDGSFDCFHRPGSNKK